MIQSDRVQMDTCKITPGLYQYTSVDDCTCYRVLRLNNRHTDANTMDFLEAVIEEKLFPIQRFQTDRGNEFFALKVQKKLNQYGIKFSSNKLASPHLNDKLERSQKTDKIEFYSTVDLGADNFSDLLAEWQQYCNWNRPHNAQNGNSPMDKYFELSEETPNMGDVHKNDFSKSERIQNQNYKVDLEVQRLKGSL